MGAMPLPVVRVGGKGCNRSLKKRRRKRLSVVAVRAFIWVAVPEASVVLVDRTMAWPMDEEDVIAT